VMEMNNGSTVFAEEDIDINALREKLLDLREWREHEGIPAIQRNEILQNTIDIRDIQNEKLQQELDTLRMESSHYTEEIEKLKADNKDLVDEIYAIRQQDDVHELTNKALLEKDQCIEILQNDLEKSQAAFQMQSKRNFEMAQINQLLNAENKQYQLILDRLQRDETSLIEKIAVYSEELRTHQLQYALLHREKEELDLEATRATLHAQQLSSQIHDVQNALQISLSHNPKENSLESDELAAFGVGNLAQNQKTMKFKDLSATDRSMRLINSPSEHTVDTEPDDIMITELESPTAYDMNQSQRGSDGSGIGSRQSHQSRASGHSTTATQSRASVGSQNPRFYDYNSNQGFYGLEQTANHTSVLSDCEEEANEEMMAFQQEFEDRIANVRETLYEQHQRELQEWQRKVEAANEQMICYKRKYLQTQTELKQMRDERDGREGGMDADDETTLICGRRKSRSRGSRTPMDGVEERNCIVFGWTAW